VVRLLRDDSNTSGGTEVTQALTGVIDGVKIVVTEPFRPATARS
jgi:hypothetical protein